MNKKLLLRIVAVVGAILLLVGIAVAALARNGGSGPMPVGPASVASQSDDPTVEPR